MQTQYRSSTAAAQAHLRKGAGEDAPQTRLSLRAPFELRSPRPQNVSLREAHPSHSARSAVNATPIPAISTPHTPPSLSPAPTDSRRMRRRTAASHWPAGHAHWAGARSSLGVAAAAHARSAPAGPTARSRRNAPSRQAGQPPRMRSRDRFGNVLCRPSRSSLPLQGKSCQGTGRPQPRSSPPRRPGLPSLPHPAAALALLLTARPLADSPAPSRRAATSPLPRVFF